MDNAKFFEAVQALAQGLSQWDLLIIGGSLVMIVSTGYYRPNTRRERLFYLLFLPSWVLLAFSIYRGIRIQGSYVAYLVAAQHQNSQLIQNIAQKMNDDANSQIADLEAALLCLGLWLVIYIFWWALTDRIREDGA
jgi:hypothetical protein